MAFGFIFTGLENLEKCQCSPVWNQPFSLAFFIIPQHSTHHDLCAHAELPGSLSPDPNHLQLHAHCGVARPAFSERSVLGNDELRNAAKWRERRVSAADAQLREARHCVSGCCLHFSAESS